MDRKNINHQPNAGKCFLCCEGWVCLGHAWSQKVSWKGLKMIDYKKEEKRSRNTRDAQIAIFLADSKFLKV